MADDQPVPLLFFSSRTALETQNFCPRDRYLSNHWGPKGYGVQPKRESVPLASGQRIHEILHPILQHCVDHDEAPNLSQVAEFAQAALQNYRDAVETRGLSWHADEESYKRMIQEQENLIVGLPVLWAMHELPILLKDWRIILAEPREVSVYACTCGLGDGIPPWESHVQRGCEGIGIMTGPDYIAQHRRAITHRYGEFKTKGSALTDAWAESFETRIQIQLGSLGVEQKHGIEIHEVYLHGLSKGARRQSEKRGEYQDSRLCWAWFKKGSPPLDDDEWAYEWEWWDAVENRSRRLGKGWEPRWVGEYVAPDGNPGLLAWIQQLPEYTVAKMLRTIGPIQRNRVAKEHALKAWIYRELANRRNLGVLFEILQGNNYNWASEEFQDALDEFFPQSWDCQRFGKRYGCSKIPICHRHPGWQDPYSIGFVDRRPHHEAELQQAISRGLLPAEDVWEGDE